MSVRLPALDLIGKMVLDTNGVTIAQNVKLALGKDATSPNEAVTKQQMDTSVSNLQAQITTIAGTDIAFDTLQELKVFIDDVSANGVINLTNAITAERDARILADDNEAATRSTNDTILSNKIFRYLRVLLSPSVYADAASPKPIPTSLKPLSLLDGWYFKNPGPSASTAEKKINWYFPSPPDSVGSSKYSSLKELNISVTIINKVSPPFITVYTKLKSSGNEASWYNARYTYIIQDTSVLENQKNYLFRAGISGVSNVGNLAGHTTVDLVKDSFTSKGTMLNDDEILFMAIGTDSSTAAGNAHFIIHALYQYSSHQNNCFLLSNDDVMQKFYLDKLDVLYASLTPNVLPSVELA